LNCPNPFFAAPRQSLPRNARVSATSFRNRAIRGNSCTSCRPPTATVLCLKSHKLHVFPPRSPICRAFTWLNFHADNGFRPTSTRTRETRAPEAPVHLPKLSYSPACKFQKTILAFCVGSHLPRAFRWCPGSAQSLSLPHRQPCASVISPRMHR